MKSTTLLSPTDILLIQSGHLKSINATIIKLQILIYDYYIINDLNTDDRKLEAIDHITASVNLSFLNDLPAMIYHVKQAIEILYTIKESIIAIEPNMAYYITALIVNSCTGLNHILSELSILNEKLPT